VVKGNRKRFFIPSNRLLARFLARMTSTLNPTTRSQSVQAVLSEPIESPLLRPDLKVWIDMARIAPLVFPRISVRSQRREFLGELNLMW
jgi:hypothetical protein